MGYSDDFKNFTLCQSIDANFRVFNNAPIILDVYKRQSLTPGMIKEMNVGDSIETVEPKSAGSDASQFLKMQRCV